MIDRIITNFERSRAWICLVASAVVIHISASWPTILRAQSDLSQLLENPLAAMDSTEMCETATNAGMDFLTPQVHKALSQCGDESDPSEKAACTTLEGIVRLSNHQNNEAFQSLRSALASYESTGDYWGAWFVQFLMGAVSHSAGDRQEADAYYQSALVQIELLAKSRRPIPARSIRLLAEIFEVPEEYAAILPLIPQLGMSSLLVDLAAVFTHYLYGASLMCQDRAEEARESFSEAQRRMSQITGRLSSRELLRDDSPSIPAMEQRPKLHKQISVEDMPNTSTPSSLIENTIPVQEALDRNKKALTSPGADLATQARLWRQRAVLLIKAGNRDEAQRAINTARAFAGIADVPLLEAEVLLNYGMDLYRLGSFDDADLNLKEGIKILNQRNIPDKHP